MILSDGWKFEQVTSLKINDDGGNRCPGQSSGNEFLLVLSRQSTHPDQLNLHQGKKIEKVIFFVDVYAFFNSYLGSVRRDTIFFYIF